MITLRVPTVLRPKVDGQRCVTVEQTPTLGGVLGAVEHDHPGFLDVLLAPDGALRPEWHIWVGADEVRGMAGLDTATLDGTEITLLTAVAGG